MARCIRLNPAACPAAYLGPVLLPDNFPLYCSKSIGEKKTRVLWRVIRRVYRRVYCALSSRAGLRVLSAAVLLYVLPYKGGGYGRGYDNPRYHVHGDNRGYCIPCEGRGLV